MTVSGGERITVEAVGRGRRLDQYLAALGRWGSRSQVQKLISAGGIQVEGQPAKAGALLHGGERIEITAAAAPPIAAEVEAEDIHLDILHEDEQVLVINKPPGMVVHPAPGNWRGTLVSALLHHWRGPRPGLDPYRPGIVHRLDKDTSGVLVIAKDPATLAALGQQFRDREVHKQYLAWVWGRVLAASGTIADPIGRHPVHRTRMAVRRGGRAAETAFVVVERAEAMTLLRLFPRTGRTHQIRVHLASIGHPIVGDTVYGRRRAQTGEGVIRRQALHAERIEFCHPATGQRVQYRAPLPADMEGLRA